MLRFVSLLPVSFIVLALSSIVLPAYAEVTTFQINRPFFTPGDKIYFNGTVGISDYQKLVNLVIHDPTGKFVLISGNNSDSTYTFKIMVDTNNTEQFYKKGTYQAIAFVGKESDGKVLNFDFSPDGSPVIHQVPPSLNVTISPGSNVSPSQNYQTQLHENVGLTDASANLTKMVMPAGVAGESTSQYDYKSILYPIISLCGAGIVIVILYMRKKNSKTVGQKPLEKQSLSYPMISDEQEDDYALMILKNRLAKGEITIDEFKVIKDALMEP